MPDADYQVVVSAGSLRSAVDAGIVMPQADFTGAHLYHLAAAGCVLNDVYREAEYLGVRIDGARVRATGGFDLATWSSTGISYEIEIASKASEEDIERLVSVVDDVAEIPKALRSGTTVARRRPR